MSVLCVFLVRGREYGPVKAYETKVPGRLFIPSRPIGDQFATLNVDCFESQSDARRLALANYRAMTGGLPVRTPGH